MRVRSWRSGIGLVEVIIGASLALLLLGLLHRLLLPVLHTGARTSVRVHLRQQAEVSIRKLQQDLRLTNGSALSYLPADPAQPDQPVVLALNRVDSVSGAGRRTYQPTVVVYTWDRTNKELRRHRIDPTRLGLAPVLSLPTLLSDDQLRQVAQGTTGPGYLLAQGVENFDPLGSWPVTLPVRATIRLEKERGGQDAPEVLELNLVLGFRN